MSAYRIISDGTPTGTIIVDRHGKHLENIQSIQYNIGLDGIGTALVKLTNVAINAEIKEEEDITFHINFIGANLTKCQ